MKTFSMSKRWIIALQAFGVMVALAVVIVVAIVAGSAASAPSHQRHAVAVHPQHHATFSLPVGVDLSAVLAILCCVLALCGWAVWQRRNRCGDCGYAPVFCQCELAGSGH
jgi:hypothetical protein